MARGCGHWGHHDDSRVVVYGAGEASTVRWESKRIDDIHDDAIDSDASDTVRCRFGSEGCDGTGRDELALGHVWAYDLPSPDFQAHVVSLLAATEGDETVITRVKELFGQLMFWRTPFEEGM